MSEAPARSARRQHRRRLSFSGIDGLMPLTQGLSAKTRVGGFFDSSLRGIGQILLMNNPVTGLLIVASLAVHDVWASLLFLLGALSGTLVARLLKYDNSLIEAGLFTFNGALLGVMTGVFLTPAWTPTILLYAVLAGAISTPIMNATVKIVTVTLGAPALSLTFGLMGVGALVVLPTVAYGHANPALLTPVDRVLEVPDTVMRNSQGGDPVNLIEGLFNATFRGISEVFLLDSVLVGVLVVVALAVCSRIAAGMAVLGSLIGALTAMVVGVDGYTVYLGLWGYNGAVVGAALFGIVLEISWRSFIFTLGACSVSALLYGALTEFLAPFGLIPLSLPLVFVIIGAALATHGSKGLIQVPPAEYSTAETRLRVARSGEL